MIIQGFKKSYGGRCVLKLPEIELSPGKVYAVLGANGSGKSTLGRVASGIERPDVGSSVCRGFSVGYMTQKSYAYRMSVKKNILLLGGDSARCEGFMKELGIAALADMSAHRLSGGETAKMALARILMGSHALLILDEPTAAMDMESTLAAEKLIRKKADEGSAVLLITHSVRQAQRIADEIIYLEKGLLAERGKTAALLSDPQDERTRRFLEFFGS